MKLRYNKLRRFEINRGKLMSAMKDDNVLTADEAAYYLKVSKATILNHIRQKRIKSVKVGRSWRILQSELYRFLKEG
jgi:excisionase family DNA binding protein